MTAQTSEKCLAKSNQIPLLTIKAEKIINVRLLKSFLQHIFETQAVAIVNYLQLNIKFEEEFPTKGKKSAIYLIASSTDWPTIFEEGPG